jgi:hypothetical protein
MNPNEKQLLQETHDLAEENNKILKGIRRSNRVSFIFRFLYWLLIIGVSIGAFYYIQPYVDKLNKAYGSLQSNVSDVQTVTNSLKDILKK